MRGAKTEARIALAIDFDAQPRTAAIALVIALNRADVLERNTLASKEVSHDVTLMCALGIDV